jgi:ribose 5-phosphate isomerase RpiB
MPKPSATKMPPPVRIGIAAAWELVETFLAARFSGAKRHRRRLAKIARLEREFPKEAL